MIAYRDRALANSEACFDLRSIYGETLDSSRLGAALKDHLPRMLQVEPQGRPSAFSLSAMFSHACQEVRFQWLRDVSKFQAVEFSDEEAFEESTRRSLSLPGSPEPPAPVRSWQEQLSLAEARAKLLLRVQQRELERLAFLRQLLSERADAFRIYVRLLPFGWKKLDGLDPTNSTIGSVKDHLQLPRYSMTLTFAGKALRDESTIDECRIPNCGTLEVILKCQWWES